jgi:formylglycine-generating enzyme required for sulfatase activity
MLLALLMSRVFVPGGEFFMGSELPEAKLADVGPGLREMMKAESPRIRARVGALFVDKHEVTNEEFLGFVREHPEYTSKTWAGGAQDPVAFVTWYAASAYCAWQYKRLPTEAEWEYAARGGQADAEYPWGPDRPTPERANYGASKVNGPVRVGMYPPNGFGLHDMAGNVWEWTADNWRDRHDAPAVPGAGARKVIRGGSFGANPLQLRVTFRDSHKPDDPVAHVGFRCVRDAR